MRKNRNKAVRKITVNNIEYGWLVSDFNCDGDGGKRLKIWHDSHNGKISIEDSVLSGSISITPKYIEKKIKSFNG